MSELSETVRPPRPRRILEAVPAVVQPPTWGTIPRPANPYRCLWCGAGFVVESMTEYHMLNNQCGLAPAAKS